VPDSKLLAKDIFLCWLQLSDANRTAFTAYPKNFGQAVIDSLRTRGYEVVEQKYIVEQKHVVERLLADWKNDLNDMLIGKRTS